MATAEGRQKSAKNDDAPVPTVLWDKQLWLCPTFGPATWKTAVDFTISRMDSPLTVLHEKFFLPLWRKSIWRSWRQFVQKESLRGDLYSEEERKADAAVAADCLGYTGNATWWEWRGGSKLFFWRWPSAIRILARDGIRTWLKGPLPSYRVPQRRERDEELLKQIAAKLENVISKGYITAGDVLSLTSYFAVPKGEGDIRMVYDRTKCGLNEVLWVPSFSLPDVENLLSMVDEDNWMAVIDIGEMFLNFPLDKFLQPFCGVDVTPYLPAFRSWLAGQLW